MERGMCWGVRAQGPSFWECVETAWRFGVGAGGRCGMWLHGRAYVWLGRAGHVRWWVGRGRQRIWWLGGEGRGAVEGRGLLVRTAASVPGGWREGLVKAQAEGSCEGRCNELGHAALGMVARNPATLLRGSVAFTADLPLRPHSPRARQISRSSSRTSPPSSSGAVCRGQWPGRGRLDSSPVGLSSPLPPPLPSCFLSFAGAGQGLNGPMGPSPTWVVSVWGPKAQGPENLNQQHVCGCV